MKSVVPNADSWILISDKITYMVRSRSCQLAIALELGTANSAGSLSCPGIERVAFGDVTVMTARAKTLPKHTTTIDRATGEIISHRHDPDVGLHTTGEHVFAPPQAVDTVRLQQTA